VLTAMGLTPAEARRTLRFGLGRFTSDADVDAALDVARTLAAQIRTLGCGLRARRQAVRRPAAGFVGCCLIRA